MENKELEEVLNRLADATEENPSVGLAEQIKEQIPHAFPHHRGLSTINIMIDLRISRLAAAAAIIITVIVCAGFLSNKTGANNIYHDSKVLLQYWLGGESKSGNEISVAPSELYKRLVPKNKDVVYYGDIVEPGDGEAILMYWKLSDGEYKVVFGDLKIKKCAVEELLKLQSRMLEKRAK